MPQLDTVYTFTTFIWTWVVLHSIMQKTKTLIISNTPKVHPVNNNQKHTPALPWT